MSQQIDIADYLQRFSVKVLWHFTGYGKDEQTAFNTLKSILTEKKLKITDRPDDVIMPDGDRRWCFPYSCVCDIPFKDLKIHTLRYGKFGIAFKKSSAISAHFNPVFYVHKDNYLFSNANALLHSLDRLSEPHAELEKTLLGFLGIVGTYVKRSDLTANISVGRENDVSQNNNFYYEREWRSSVNWEFDLADIEAVMIPKSFFILIKEHLHSRGMSNIPIIPFEAIESF